MKLITSLVFLLAIIALPGRAQSSSAAPNSPPLNAPGKEYREMTDVNQQQPTVLKTSDQESLHKRIIELEEENARLKDQLKKVTSEYKALLQFINSVDLPPDRKSPPPQK